MRQHRHGCDGQCGKNECARHIRRGFSPPSARRSAQWTGLERGEACERERKTQIWAIAGLCPKMPRAALVSLAAACCRGGSGRAGAQAGRRLPIITHLSEVLWWSRSRAQVLTLRYPFLYPRLPFVRSAFVLSRLEIYSSFIVWPYHILGVYQRGRQAKPPLHFANLLAIEPDVPGVSSRCEEGVRLSQSSQ